MHVHEPNGFNDIVESHHKWKVRLCFRFLFGSYLYIIQEIWLQDKVGGAALYLNDSFYLWNCCFKFVVPITQIYIDKLVSYQTRISPLPLNASHDRHFMALMHKGCTPGIVACILSSFINFHEPIIRPKYRNDMEILPQRVFGFLTVLDLPPYLATDL